MEKYDEDLNTTLIFVSFTSSFDVHAPTRPQAGLFSAVTSAFIIEVHSHLQQDPNDVTAALLCVLYKTDIHHLRKRRSRPPTTDRPSQHNSSRPSHPHRKSRRFTSLSLSRDARQAVVESKWISFTRDIAEVAQAKYQRTQEGRRPVGFSVSFPVPGTPPSNIHCCRLLVNRCDQPRL